MDRYKFFNGPHVGQILEGELVKHPGYGFMLAMKDHFMVDLEFSMRLAEGWKDIKMIATSDEFITFVAVYNNGKLSDPFKHEVSLFT